MFVLVAPAGGCHVMETLFDVTALTVNFKMGVGESETSAGPAAGTSTGPPVVGKPDGVLVSGLLLLPLHPPASSTVKQHKATVFLQINIYGFYASATG